MAEAIVVIVGSVVAAGVDDGGAGEPNPSPDDGESWVQVHSVWSGSKHSVHTGWSHGE